MNEEFNSVMRAKTDSKYIWTETLVLIYAPKKIFVLN